MNKLIKIAHVIVTSISLYLQKMSCCVVFSLTNKKIGDKMMKGRMNRIQQYIAIGLRYF